MVEKKKEKKHAKDPSYYIVPNKKGVKERWRAEKKGFDLIEIRLNCILLICSKEKAPHSEIDTGQKSLLFFAVLTGADGQIQLKLFSLEIDFESEHRVTLRSHI